MVVRFPPALAALLAASLAGCNAPEPPGNTGGTTIEPGPCGRGLVVVESDYQSSNVSLVGFGGEVLSSSLISSASGDVGLSAPLTGDVVAPTMPQTGPRLAVLDRYPAGVLTWIDVATGRVRAQLPANQGFAANPQDYAEIAADKAYISRLDPNPHAGAEPFDGGSDLLIVDPTRATATGRVDLAPAMIGEDPSFYPRPTRIVLDGDRAIVLLSAYALSFTASASSRLVVIDPASDAIVSVKVLDGLHGCTGLGLAPGGGRVVVSCSGTFQSDEASKIAESGLAVLARHGDTLEEEARFPAADLGPGPLGFSAAFAGAGAVVYTTFGRDAAGGAPAVDDTFASLDLASGEHIVLLRSHGTPFSLGEVRCAAACGACFVTDAETDHGVVHRFTAENGVLAHDQAIRAETKIGLPPRYVGQF